MNLTDSNNMLYFFTMYNYLNELHCSQKYYIAINSNLFIKNYINYIHICTFIYVNLIMFILREKCRWYIFIQAYIDLYRSLLLLFQKLFYRGKKNYIQANSTSADLSIKIHHQLDFKDVYSLFFLLLWLWKGLKAFPFCSVLWCYP